jgi:hypothetical protein
MDFKMITKETVFQLAQDALNHVKNESDTDIKVQQVYMIKYLFACGLKITMQELQNIALYVINGRRRNAGLMPIESL